MLHGKKIAALCTSRINDTQVNHFMHDLNKRLVELDYRLLVYNINMDIYWKENYIPAEASVYDLVDYKTADVVIVMSEKIKSNTVSGRIIAKARENGVPAIVVDGNLEGAVCICFDYEKGFEKIVRHVIEDHEVRKPHFMAGVKGEVFSEARLKVFKRVIAENGIPFSDSMVSYGEFWSMPAIQAAQRIIDSGDIPEAIICANDIMAINVCDVLAKNGIKVPDQVIVSGFDGSEEIFSFSPTISSVSCDISLLARTVAETVLEIEEGYSVSRSILVEPQMLPNESCGCPKYIDSRLQVTSFNNGFYRYQDDLRVLFEMAGRVQMSSSAEQAAKYLNDDTYLLNDRILHNMCIVINKSCLNNEVNYFSDDVSGDFEDEMYLFYDSYSKTGGKTVPRGDSYPPLNEMFEKRCPIIYSSIVFMDKIIGYLCFSFDKYNIISYSSIFQIAAAMSTALGGYITSRHQKYLYDRVEELYKTDALTGLYNRHGFQTILSKYKKDHIHVGNPVTIISSDLDGLKYINDNFGHDSGDFAILSAANILKSSCPEDSLCIRIGGDEMLAIVFGEHSPEQILERISKSFDELNSSPGMEYTIYASCGFYKTVLTEDFDLDNALRQSDAEMYASKKRRKRENSSPEE